MTKIKIEIPEAHGQAIAERAQIMQQIGMQFSLFRAEDKRHVDAVLKSLAYEPEDYEQYDLKVERKHYYLELQPKAQPQAAMAQPEMPQQPLASAPVNGAPQPPLAVVD